MTKAAYAVGDHVFLASGPIKTGRPEGEFMIVACLPDINGGGQYRVKSLAENFERRIVSSDIDMERSHAALRSPEPIQDLVPTQGSWLQGTSIRIGK